MSGETRYPVQCQCGGATPVAASAAGSVIECQCGRQFRVPRLSELRRQAGQAAFELSTVEIIRRMISNGTLPVGYDCAYSHVPTSDVMQFRVVCETPYSSAGYSWWWLFLIGMFSVVLYAIASRETGEVQGREVVVQLPLRISRERQAEVR